MGDNMMDEREGKQRKMRKIDGWDLGENRGGILGGAMGKNLERSFPFTSQLLHKSFFSPFSPCVHA